MHEKDNVGFTFAVLKRKDTTESKSSKKKVFKLAQATRKSLSKGGKNHSGRHERGFDPPSAKSLTWATENPVALMILTILSDDLISAYIGVYWGLFS